MDVEYKDRHLLNNAAEVKLGSVAKASIFMTIANADKLYTIDMEHEDSYGLIGRGKLDARLKPSSGNK